MKKLLFLALLSIFFLATTSHALTGLGIGVRGGYLSGYDNPDLALTTGSVDKMPMLGAHVNVGFIPVFDIVFSGEYAWQTEKDFLPGVDLTYGDLSVNGTAIYKFSMPVISPYVGAGLGFHRLIYSWDGTYPGVAPGDQTKMSWHGVGGLTFSFPAMPFEFFVEGRYSSLRTEAKATNYPSFLGGITFGMP
ncbi:MAG: hypothetical protein L0Y74_00795 [candidate division Zixibacteria bacterium]|nr:hypothetical protein [candidate division Zixibacteria bacterium]